MTVDIDTLAHKSWCEAHLEDCLEGAERYVMGNCGAVVQCNPLCPLDNRCLPEVWKCVCKRECDDEGDDV